MPAKLHPRAQTTREHLIRSLWPLQRRGGALPGGAVAGWQEGRKARAEFLARPAAGHTALRTPWGGEALDFAGATAIAIPKSPLTGLATFTLEAWVRFDDVLAGNQVLFEHVGRASDYWRLMLDRWGRLCFIWMRRAPPARERANQADWATGGGGDVPALTHAPDDLRTCRTYHLSDAVVPGRWHHLVFMNMGMGHLEICLTPEGDRFPRLACVANPPRMDWSGSGPGALVVGGTQRKGEFFRGSICDLAVFPHAKRRNEFPALGQRPPRSFRISADYPLGSVLLPVENGPDSVVLGCRPAPYQQKSFWFDARLDGVKGREIGFEALPWPYSLGMISSAWVSYDRRRWRRVGGAHFDREAPHRESAHFRHRFERSPAWIAASIPYGIEEIDRLESDVKGSAFVRTELASTSTEGRPLRAFLCTDPATPNSVKRAIYLQAGQHSPAEMLAGHALDQAIRRCARPAGFVRELLRRAILVIVPVVNQDTAFHGCSSSVASGINLNRDWWTPRSAEVIGLKAFIERFHANVAPITFAVDFHGGGWRAHTILCRAEAANEEAFAGCHAIQEKWLAALTRHADFAPRDISRETRDHQKHPVNRGIFTTALRHQLKIPAVVAEMSTMVTWDRRRARYTGLTQPLLQRMGPDLLRTVDEFLR